jgi:hypothetical protein
MSERMRRVERSDVLALALGAQIAELSLTIALAA